MSAQVPITGIRPVLGVTPCRTTVAFPAAQHQYQLILLSDRSTCV